MAPSPTPPAKPEQSPASMAERVPSSNRQRKKALRERRERREARREARRPKADPTAEAEAHLRASRRTTRNHLEAIRRMAAGQTVDLPHLSYLSMVREILDGARRRGAVDAALVLVHAALGTRLLRDNPGPVRAPTVNAFVNLARRRDAWIRRPQDWHATRGTASAQLSSLIHHLLARYPLPVLLDEAWTMPHGVYAPGDRAETYQSWFLHVAGGQNLRTAPKLPFALTKRMAHHAFEADPTLGLSRAIRYGQARAIGLDDRAAHAFASTHAGDIFETPGGREADAFWASVLHFLARHAMLDPDCIGRIVDYVVAMRFVPVPRPDGADAPLQPNLSMRGRRLDTLLAQTDAWHARVARIERTEGRRWASIGRLVPAGSGPKARGRFECTTGSGKDPERWSVVELLTSRELAADGRALAHCVYSYAWSCERGRSAIWSVRIEEETGISPRVTLEVHPASGRIVQARGRHNRPPKPVEWTVIERFARAAGFTGVLSLRERLQA